jgi:hypothetical protein
MKDSSYTNQRNSDSEDRMARTFSISNSLSSTRINSHRQRKSRHLWPSDSDMRPDPAYNHRHPRRSETRKNDRLCSPHACMQIPPVLHVIASSEVATTRYTRPDNPSIYRSTCPPTRQPTNLISASMIRQESTIDKTDVAVRVPSRSGRQVQDRAGHLVFDSHPLRRNQSPWHHAARVLPRFGDGGCHVGGEP